MLPFQGASVDDHRPAAMPEDAVFVRVAVERALDRDEGLTYWSDAPIEPGTLVRVPIGSSDTLVPGVVLDAGDATMLKGIDPGRVKGVARVETVRVRPLQLRLCRWIGEYYACPIGMVLAGAVPGAVRAQTGRRTVRVIGYAEPLPETLPKLPPAARDAWARINDLDPSALPMEKSALKRRLELRSIAPIHRLRDEGLLTESESSQIRVPSAFRVLEDDADAAAPELTDEQQGVVSGIERDLGSFANHLIHGVTGSGKTEVYVRLIERVLARGHRALVLVPEIGLTPQTAGRFVARFRDAWVAILHSGMSASARHAQWSLVDRGEAGVIIGARSALFAPIDDLGLVVVDEEHDGSYKQDRAPRYHARDGAIMLAHMAGCPAVLGSATPSLESWANVDRKRSTLWTLSRRASGRPMPEVRIIDLTRERPASVRTDAGKRAAFPQIGPTLEHAIHDTLGRGEQIMLMLNRRGYASVVACANQSCEWLLRCDACDSSMVVHKSSVRTRRGSRFVRCHHCGAEQLIPDRCPLSGDAVVQIGAGTQRAEDEVMARFADRHALELGNSLVRVDSDTMTGPRDYFETLDRFRRGEIRVMLGTQMIAKGLDFPNVTLVGVLSADTALAIPDFRAEERTFQLVAQVAGRAGRGQRPGLVLVQSVNPRSPAIQLAARHDSAAFARRELDIRQRSGLPPATRLARIIARDTDPRRAKSRAGAIAEALAAIADPRVTIAGPSECIMARIAEHTRWEIELSAPTAALLHHPINRLRAEGTLKPDASTVVDVDPLWML